MTIDNEFADLAKKRLRAKRTHDIFEQRNVSCVLVGHRYTWNNGEIDDVFDIAPEGIVFQAIPIVECFSTETIHCDP